MAASSLGMMSQTVTNTFPPLARAAARRFFNAATTEYNNSVESFPSNLVAKNFGFNREIMFDLGTDTRKQMEEPPKIQF